jgi:hypothetical protein
VSEQQASRAVVPVQATPVGEVDHLMTLARAFAESGYFADAHGWAQALVKIQAGRELGFGPMAAMAGIHIVNGKPTLSANLIAAAIRRSGQYDYQVDTLNDQLCELRVFRDGKAVENVTFTIEDARRAGLLDGKNAHTWKRYPRNMLFARAISNLAKWYCPDVFTTGVYADGELDDQPEPVRITAQVQSSPGRSDGKMSADEAEALADLRKMLMQGRGIIDQKPADALWLEIVGRWGVKSAHEMDLGQRKELVSYLVTQIQAEQMRKGLEGNGAGNDLEGDAAAAAAGGH